MGNYEATQRKAFALLGKLPWRTAQRLHYSNHGDCIATRFFFFFGIKEDDEGNQLEYYGSYAKPNDSGGFDLIGAEYSMIWVKPLIGDVFVRFIDNNTQHRLEITCMGPLLLVIEKQGWCFPDFIYFHIHL